MLTLITQQMMRNKTMEIEGKLSKKTHKITIIVRKPVCKKCRGELSILHVLTSGKLYGYNRDEDQQATIGFESNGINLYSCKNTKCKWFGLLTQITDIKITKNTTNNGI